MSPETVTLERGAQAADPAAHGRHRAGRRGDPGAQRALRALPEEGHRLPVARQRGQAVHHHARRGAGDLRPAQAAGTPGRGRAPLKELGPDPVTQGAGDRARGPVRALRHRRRDERQPAQGRRRRDDHHRARGRAAGRPPRPRPGDQEEGRQEDHREEDGGQEGPGEEGDREEDGGEDGRRRRSPPADRGAAEPGGRRAAGAGRSRSARSRPSTPRCARATRPTRSRSSLGDGPGGCWTSGRAPACSPTSLRGRRARGGGGRSRAGDARPAGAPGCPVSTTAVGTAEAIPRRPTPRSTRSSPGQAAHWFDPAPAAARDPPGAAPGRRRSA